MPASLKKVLYLSPNGFVGGAERFILDASLGHLQLGHYKSSLFFLNKGLAIDWALEHKIPYHVLPFTLRFSRPWSFIKAVLYLRHYLKQEQIDVINEAMPYAHILSFFATWGLKIKKVWFQHGPVGGILDRIAVMLKADLVLFNSEFLKREQKKIRSFFQYPSAQAVCNYGIRQQEISEQEIQELIDRYGLKGKKVFIHAARICPWKGQNLLIESLAQIKKENESLLSSISLLILGQANNLSDQNYQKSCQELVAKNGLSSCVKWLGHQKRVLPFFKLAHLVFHTSLIPEPFGLSVAEAQSQGAIVLGSSRGGVSDILKEGETGFNFDSESPLASSLLAKKIIFVLKKIENEEEKSKIQKNAKSLIAEQYSLTGMIKRLEFFYSNL